MKHSESIAKLAAALVAAQAEVRAVGLDSSNPDYRSKYASLDKIIETIRPTLARHGLAVVQGATTPHTDEKSRIAAIAVETMLVHSSGEWLTNTAIMPVVGRMLKGGGRADVDPQAGGSALSYGRRYGLSALLCLATDEDDDGNAASKQPQRSEAARTSGPASAGTGAVGHKGPIETGAAPTTQSRPASNTLGAEDYVMPMGKQKGKTLGQMTSDDLITAAEWIESHSMTKKYGELLTGIKIVLAAREVRASA